MKKIFRVTFVIEENDKAPYETEQTIFFIGPNYKKDELENELLSLLKDVPGRKYVKEIVEISGNDA